MSQGGSPRALLSEEDSGGCVRCSGTNSRPSAWPWQLLSTTVLEKVEMQQNGAPRGQKTAARVGEEVEYEKHAGTRAQKTPPPGERPGLLCGAWVPHESAIAPCGAPQDRKLLSSWVASRSQLPRLTALMLPHSPSSRPKRWKTGGRRRRRPKMKEKEAQEMKLKELEARQRAVVRELDHPSPGPVRAFARTRSRQWSW